MQHGLAAYAWGTHLGIDREVAEQRDVVQEGQQVSWTQARFLALGGHGAHLDQAIQSLYVRTLRGLVKGPRVERVRRVGVQEGEREPILGRRRQTDLQRVAPGPQWSPPTEHVARKTHGTQGAQSSLGYLMELVGRGLLLLRFDRGDEVGLHRPLDALRHSARVCTRRKKAKKMTTGVS